MGRTNILNRALAQTVHVRDLLQEARFLMRKLGYPLALALHLAGITANQMTGFRLVGAPMLVGLAVSYTEPGGRHWWLGLILLFFALTDLLDGLLADLERKSGDDIGALLDPPADKLLIGSLYLVHFDYFPAIVLATLVGEVILVLLAFCYKILAIDDPHSTSKISANIWGKTKMTLEVTTAFLMIVYSAMPEFTSLWLAVNTIGLLAIGFLVGSLLGKIKII